MKLAPLLLVALAGCASQRPAAAPVDACTGVSGSPLDGASIAAVHRLVDKDESENRKVAFTRVAGAEIALRAESGVTAESLERRARCHAARVAGTEHDPLAVKDASVRVRPREAAFGLQITSKDPHLAREIFARAERLPR